jgi:hypothetical protein
MTLGSDIFAEVDVILEETAKKAPVLIAYSGGEMCPTQINPKAAINRFHNNAVIFCIL